MTDTQKELQKLNQKMEKQLHKERDIIDKYYSQGKYRGQRLHPLDKYRIGEEKEKFKNQTDRLRKQLQMLGAVYSYEKGKWILL